MRRIDWVFFYRGFDSGQRIAQIVATEIFHVRAGELFSLTIAAAGIGKENVITTCGERGDDRARHSE